jgi:O-antigen ligase
MLFVFRITFLIRMRDSDSYTSLDIYNLIQIGSILMLAFLLLKYKKLYIRFKNQSINYFSLLFLIGIVSGIWSTNVFYSSYRAFEAMILLMASITLLTYVSFDFEFAEKFFMKLLFAIGFLSFFGLLMRRSSISIASLHSNGYPIIGAIMASYAFGALSEIEYYVKRRKFMKKFLIFGLFLIVAGTSLGSVLAFLVAVCIVLLYSKKMNKNYIALLFFIAIIIVFLAINAAFIEDLILVNKDVDELEGLNGRTRLWEIYLQMIYEKPITGWGFDVISRQASEVYATNTHFFLISILGGLGLVGLTIFFIGFFKLIKELFRYKKYQFPSHLAFMASLGAAFVNGGSKGYIGEHAYAETVVFFLTLSFFAVCYQYFKNYGNEEKEN